MSLGGIFKNQMLPFSYLCLVKMQSSENGLDYEMSIKQSQDSLAFHFNKANKLILELYNNNNLQIYIF